LRGRLTRNLIYSTKPVPSLLFMVVIHKFMRPEMMAKLGK
ncbi:hypothetical protein LMJ16_22915, partial [Klebsiella pneumoniae]|nr:hypothetical protein [Klebsiella pneumoniae]